MYDTWHGSLDDMKDTAGGFKLPTLYQKAQTGKIKEWTVAVIKNDDGTATIRKVHGSMGHTLKTDDKVIYKGKNIGKSNETTPLEQAVSQAKSDYKKKLDKGYTTDPDSESDIVLPMLAQPFQKSKHRIKYPAAIQPKLNGVRCLAFRTPDGIDFRSRKGKSYNGALNHLAMYLIPVMKAGDILDGEIYGHDLTFQQITRRVKKYRPGKSEKLQYWIYDKVGSESFDKRSDDLMEITKCLDPTSFPSVLTLPAMNENDVMLAHDEFVKQGYEGVMIRNVDAPYAINKRVADLQKFKKFFDKEVKIVGGKEGTGLEEGCVVFFVEDEYGNRFWSRPRGSRAIRKQWMADIDNLIGKNLTIRYQELSEDNVPIFNVGIAIRDYE